MSKFNSADQALRDRYAPKYPRLSKAEEAELMRIAALGIETDEQDDDHEHG